MTVEKFKKEIKDLEKKNGLKYKVHYKGYKEGLETNRLDPSWHKEVTLASVTNGEKTIIFRNSGELSADLVDETGETLETYSDVLSPYPGILEDDASLETLEKMVGEYIVFGSRRTVIAECDGESYEFEGDIVDAIFDAEKIVSILGPGKEEEAPEEEEKIVWKKDAPEPEESPEEEPGIKDSGNRTEFPSGAVRDVQKGKGRCDLLPLDIVSAFLSASPTLPMLESISVFQSDGDYYHLIEAARSFSDEQFDSPETAILEYAKHLEDGCSKYGDRNWEKGIPLERYIDSGVRHYLKFRRGDKDERHDRAFIWNMLCGAWTAKHI